MFCLHHSMSPDFENLLFSKGTKEQCRRCRGEGPIKGRLFIRVSSATDPGRIAVSEGLLRQRKPARSVVVERGQLYGLYSERDSSASLPASSRSEAPSGKVRRGCRQPAEFRIFRAFVFRRKLDHRADVRKLVTSRHRRAEKGAAF